MQERLPNSVLVVFFVVALALSHDARAQTPDASYMAGCASFKNGDMALALERFTQAITRNNADERLFIYRGRVYLQKKDYEHAILDFKEANDIIPGVSDIWLARTYALAGEQENALKFLENHLASGYRLPEDSIKKDPAFDGLQTAQGWYSLWEKEWYNAEEKTGAEVAYYQRKGLTDKAISFLDAEVGKSPSSTGLLILRGEANYQKGNYAAAIADITSALSKNKNNSGAVYPPLTGLPASMDGVWGVYTLRGQAYLKASRHKDALADFNRVLKENPANFEVYLLRAQANAGMKSYDAAVRDVLTYLQYFEHDQNAVYLCGEYYFQAEDYINALKYFNRNLKEDPNNSLYFKSRGKTYLKAATYRYAINDLSMSLDLNPDDAETWMYFGLAKILSGDKENGCSDLEKSRNLGSTEVLKYLIENCQ